MEFIKKLLNLTTAFSCLLIVLGVCLISAPNATIGLVCYFLSALIIMSGVCTLIEYFTDGFNSVGLVSGIGQIGVGILFAIFTPVLAIAEIFAIVVGACLFISALLKIQTAVDSYRQKYARWWVYLISSVVLITLAVLLLINPFTTMRVFFVILGATIIVEGLLNIASILLVKNDINEAEKKTIDTE